MTSPTTGSVIGGDIFLSAAGSGDLRMLKKTVAKLDNGVEGSFSKMRDSDGSTALHMAAGQGHTRMCKYLIKTLKFDVNIQDDEGVTPLTYAISLHWFETASYLLENGASLTITNNLGCTPLHLAATCGSKDLVELFVSKGADIEANSDCGTPLACGAALDFQGNKQVVKFLLQNNANHTPLKSGYNPLIASSSVSLACTDLLVKAGADPNTFFYGVTPLLSAVVGEKAEIIVYLLNAGANPNIVNYMGLTPLEVAAFMRDVKSMIFLFPVTTPIPFVQDWSIKGLMNYINSAKAEEKMNLMSKESFNMAKLKGDEAVKNEDYWVALNWYKMANRADRSNATILCDKSICYACLNLGNLALSEAKECVSMKPEWANGHYHEGLAWKILKKFNEAVKSLTIALKLEPDNLEIRKALREAIEAKIGEIRI